MSLEEKTSPRKDTGVGFAPEPAKSKRSSTKPFYRSSSLSEGLTKMINKRRHSGVTSDLTGQRIPGEICKVIAKQIQPKSLRVILRNNEITKIGASFTQHPHLQYLRHLDLSQNQIRRIPDSILFLSELTELNVSENKLQSFPPILCQLPQLQKLNLSHNSIQEIPECINEFPKLRKLKLTDNYIHKLPVVMKDNKTIRKLKMLNNPTISPPLYIIERGMDVLKKYIQVLQEETPATIFEFRFVAPFTTESTVDCNANYFTTRENATVYNADDIKAWRVKEKQNYMYTMQIGLTRDQGRRNYMEDRAEAKSWEPFPEVLPDFKAAYVAVYDGHGGSVAVDLVLDNLRTIIMDQWRSELYSSIGIDSTQEIPEDNILQIGTPERNQLEKISLTILPSVLFRAFTLMQEVLENVWQQTGESDGTTAVINILVYNKLFTAHCGDSRGVLVRGGKGFAFTRDHKPNCPRERERIENLGGVVRKHGGSIYRVDGNLSVSRTLGDCRYKPAVSATPEVSIVTLTPGDSYIILASDGLWDVVSSEEAAEIATAAMSVRNCSEDLVRAALQKDSKDNISVVAIALRWDIFHSTNQFLNDISVELNEDANRIHAEAESNLFSPRSSNSQTSPNSVGRKIKRKAQKPGRSKSATPMELSSVEPNETE